MSDRDSIHDVVSGGSPRLPSPNSGPPGSGDGELDVMRDYSAQMTKARAAQLPLVKLGQILHALRRDVGGGRQLVPMSQDELKQAVGTLPNRDGIRDAFNNFRKEVANATAKWEAIKEKSNSLFFHPKQHLCSGVIDHWAFPWLSLSWGAYNNVLLTYAHKEHMWFGITSDHNWEFNVSHFSLSPLLPPLVFTTVSAFHLKGQKEHYWSLLSGHTCPPCLVGELPLTECGCEFKGQVRIRHARVQPCTKSCSCTGEESASESTAASTH